ncbi:MAG TPA: hydrogenase nickel incorporation protein HypB [Planctomycetota bacterium]|nr:hydrogenase nickel incorporation protein HypB [Planctomycetota bacterium]
MCGTCGCDGDQGEAGVGHGRGHAHDHDHEHDRGAGPLEIDVPIPILAANAASAQRIRSRLARLGVRALNVLGTPGAGKTALLETTLARLAAQGVRAAVIVADLATENDAKRLRGKGAPVIALETGITCHVTAAMVEKALEQLDLAKLDILFVENVGNLVCPALFDLGEEAKVVLTSVTEGEDKPEKYPVMFQHADLMIVNKIDLLPHVDFDLSRTAELARRVHPEIEVMTLSARTGEGVQKWLDWIEELRRSPRRQSAKASTAAAS